MAKFVSQSNLTKYDKKEKERTENTYSKKTELGELSTLTTTDKTSAVSAINELKTNIGDLTQLNTTAKDSIVNAINEVNTKSQGSSDYAALTNKPQIENHELAAGNNTAASLGLAKDNEVVKLSGNQTIAGTKTLSNSAVFTGSDAVIQIKTDSANADHCIAWYKNNNTRYANLGPGSSQNSDFQIEVTDTLKISAATISFNNKKLSSVADPAANSDAATKNYVDTTLSPVSTKADSNEQAITDLRSKLDKLTGEALQWVGKDTQHTTAQYTQDKSLITAFAVQQGFSKPLPKGLLVIDSDSHTWFYAGSNDDWEDWGISSVQVANNNSLGVTKGSADVGKVNVLVDGTMQVNGFQTIEALTDQEIDAMFP